MKQKARYLIGPEFLWLLVYIVALCIAGNNRSPDPRMEPFIDSAWFLVPGFGLLSVALLWIPNTAKNWMIPRIWIAGLAGSHLVLDTLIGSLPVQGPGEGMAYIAGMILMICCLLSGTAIVLFFPSVKKYIHRWIGKGGVSY